MVHAPSLSVTSNSLLSMRSTNFLRQSLSTIRDAPFLQILCSEAREFTRDLPHLLSGLLADLPLSAATSRTLLSVRDGTTKMLFLMSQNQAQVLSGMFNCFLLRPEGLWPSRAQWLSSSPPLAMSFSVFVDLRHGEM